MKGQVLRDYRKVRNPDFRFKEFYRTLQSVIQIGLLEETVMKHRTGCECWGYVRSELIPKRKTGMFTVQIETKVWYLGHNGVDVTGTKEEKLVRNLFQNTKGRFPERIYLVESH